MTRYTSATDADRREMLAKVGMSSIADLFADIPENLRLARPLDLPGGMSEQDVYAHLAELSSRNRHADEETTFLGAGMYDHYVPAIVDAIVQRSEFLTPYTPYQPEISQGGLQVMFEYQTAISELTGLPVSNASLYEGPSSVAAAGYLAVLENRNKRRFVVSRGLHPHSRETLETYSLGYGTEVVETPLDEKGATDVEALAAAIDEGTGAVFLQQPNFLGTVEDLQTLVDAAKAKGALALLQGDPMTLGILCPPGCPRPPWPARGLRRGNRGGGGPAAREPARLRRPVVRLLRRAGALHPQDARPDRGRDRRRRGQAWLRAHPADARAAHPAREGDPQHLHRPGPQRAR